MRRLAVGWHYFRATSRVNIGLSVIASVFAAGAGSLMGIGQTDNSRVIYVALRVFLFSYATAGTTLGNIVYRMFRREEYPFYYNAGLRIRQLVVLQVTINLTVCSILLPMLSHCFL